MIGSVWMQFLEVWWRVVPVSGSYSGVCIGPFTRAVYSAWDLLGSHESQSPNIFLSRSHGKGVVVFCLCCVE